MDRTVLELLLLAPLLLLPASVLLLLGVIATRKRPEPRNADEADADPTAVVDIACLAGAKESMGLGRRRRKVVTAARASPTRRRRAIVRNFFLNYWEIIWFGEQKRINARQRRAQVKTEPRAVSDEQTLLYIAFRCSNTLSSFVFNLTCWAGVAFVAAFVCVGLGGCDARGSWVFPVKPAQAAHLTSAAEIGKTENHTNQTGNHDGREAGSTDGPGGSSADLGRSPLGERFQVSGFVSN